MRIWDIDPGFLNDQSLLGEHRELHGIASILIHHKKGYSRHPETLRWRDHLPALAQRHGLQVAEMRLRGFNHHSPLPEVSGATGWPPVFIDLPAHQYTLLGHKYLGKAQGRLPLPRNPQELWARHKYSVMARDYNSYRRYGKLVAARQLDFDRLAAELVAWLRKPPPPEALVNGLTHMWGYVGAASALQPAALAPDALLAEIQRLAMAPDGAAYLRHSTALGELAGWLQRQEG